MADKILRLLGLGALAEIGRRPDDGHAQVRPDPHSYHVLGNLLAASHAGVIAIRNDVTQTVVNGDLDFDIGILWQQWRQFRQQNGVGGVFRRSDADRASWRAGS